MVAYVIIGLYRDFIISRALSHDYIKWLSPREFSNLYSSACWIQIYRRE